MRCKFREVRDFQQGAGDALPIPNLIDVQIESYQRFLQQETEGDQAQERRLGSFAARRCSRSRAMTGICGWNISATT